MPRARATDDDLVDDWVASDIDENPATGDTKDAMSDGAAGDGANGAATAEEKAKKKRAKKTKPAPAAESFVELPDLFPYTFWHLYGTHIGASVETTAASITATVDQFSCVEAPVADRLLDADFSADVLKPPAPRDASDSPGSPVVLFLAFSTDRALAVFRELKASPVNTACRVACLFPKHKKLAEHVSLLKTTFARVVITTVGRAQKLIEADALKLDACKAVWIDGWCDRSKRWSQLDFPDIRANLMQLFHTCLLPRVRQTGLRITLVRTADTPVAASQSLDVLMPMLDKHGSIGAGKPTGQGKKRPISQVSPASDKQKQGSTQKQKQKRQQQHQQSPSQQQAVSVPKAKKVKVEHNEVKPRLHHASDDLSAFIAVPKARSKR